ncbi:Inner membrane protein YohD [Pseudobythopirellula maris]|uniref:Inner membrane protein YohD n=1 Tax=Pseudobythopirellula maris TaxID=2527991 RepID=A0A5C5ZUB1_9BACT|nr:DedA family protein [Pseudobythopirellula maris]TWT90796.1 Inner membrane protein YohD [Pseudobythopirellula maris]
MLDSLFGHLGYLGIVAFLALCGCGIPVPEEAPLVLAGVLSSNGTLNPTLAFGSCLLGALLGDSVMYGLGRHFGHEWLTKHPSVSRFINAEKEEKLEHVVQRHGFKVVVLTRFLIGVRGPVYYAAGAAKVPYLRFLLWDLVAASIVVSAVFGLSYYYGERIAELVGDAERAATLVVLLVLLVGGFFLYRAHQRRMDATLEKYADEDEESETSDAAAEAQPGVVAAHSEGTQESQDSSSNEAPSNEAQPSGAPSSGAPSSKASVT